MERSGMDIHRAKCYHARRLLPQVVSVYGKQRVVCGLDHGQRVLQSCHTEDSGIWAGSPRLAVTTMLYKCVAEANSSANMTIRPLRIVVPDGTLVRTFSQLANGSSSSFSRATGVPIEFVIMPPVAYSMARGSMLLDTSPPTADSGYDAIMVAPTAFGDAAQVPGKLLDLSYIVSDDTMLDWEGIRPQFRGTAVTYDGAVVALPLLPVPFFTYYHLPIFQRDGLRPPRTWEEFADLAERYHGRERPAPAAADGRCLWFERALEDDLVKVQKDFLQELAGAQRPTNRLLFREFGQRPLQQHWAALAFRFWNDLCQARDTIYHSAFRNELRLAFESDFNYDGWGAKMLRVYRCLGYNLTGMRQDMDIDSKVNCAASTRVEVGELLKLL
ncbi:hypothetical protein Agub_g4144 [Astrephomene gubernaculifera]|uniref:Uncharacterized protein n=1 Tax=Astrephomene gubernaculifera TaxID=47775 RepID=A0AAD3HJQ9_9CHLO|nr:hypothetical protein Agub_g4144 [Astrephomene gubernaculifera]